MISPSEYTIEIHFVQAALQGLIRRGYAIEGPLATAGISPALLEQTRSRVSLEQFSALMLAVWRLLDDELSGFGTHPIKLGSLELVCETIIRRPTLRSALQRAVEVYRLIQPNQLLNLTENHVDAGLSVSTVDLDDPQHFAMESLLMTWHRLSSWLIGRRISLSRVEFDYAEPAHRGTYGVLFDAPLRFGAECCTLCIPIRYLDAPVVQDEDSLRVFIRGLPLPLLKRPERGQTMTARVRHLWARRGVELGLDAMACELNMSAMTMRRRLQDEGETFQSLKDQWRRDVVIRLLVHSQLSLSEVAVQAGFSEPSALNRAFKKWTGLTPGAYRQAESTFR